MSDNDRAIEMGLIDVHGNILVNDEPEDDHELGSYQENHAVKYNFKEKYNNGVLVSLYIDLTPMHFLNDEQASVRKKLLAQQEDKIHLIVKHNPNNPHDNKALEVYYQETFIGYIRKNYDPNLMYAKSSLEDFCFYRDSLEDIELIYNYNYDKYTDNKFTLRKSITDIVKGIEQTQRLEKEDLFLLKIWEWALENEIDTIPFRKKEALELTFLRFEKKPDSYGFKPSGCDPVEYEAPRQLPREIFKLPKLNAISFEGLGLTSLPSEIGDLVNLDTLWLNRNNLSELPSTMEKLQNLETIDLGDNKFTKFPKVLFSMPHIEVIYLCCNSLTTIPSEIEKLYSLKTLSLGNNQLTRLPNELGSLVNLQELSLHGNKLTYLPETLSENDSIDCSVHNNTEEINRPGEKEPGIGYAVVFWGVFIIIAILVSS